MGINKMAKLHIRIGKLIDKNLVGFSNCHIFKDKACGGKNYIGLFCAETKSRDVKYCEVDILILKDNKIKVVIEIEESSEYGPEPKQIFGKFLATALSKRFIHDEYENYEMNALVTFIQVIDLSRLKEATKKDNQFKIMEKSISDILPLKNGNVDSYKLFSGRFSNKKDSINIFEELINYIKEVLM